MIIVWILSYLAVFFIGAIFCFTSLMLFSTQEERKLRRMPAPRIEDRVDFPLEFHPDTNTVS